MVSEKQRKKEKGSAENGDEEEVFLPAWSGGGGPADLFPAIRRAFEVGHPEGLLRRLHAVEKRKETEIEELCKSHYEEFIAAVDELRSILAEADTLKREVSGRNSRLQNSGDDLLLRSDCVIENRLLRGNLVSALKLSAFCVRLLELCLRCNSHLAAGCYYPALLTLEIIENSRFDRAPLPSVLKLAIRNHIPKVQLHIEAEACSDFENWLAHIRGTSEEVGRSALSRVESARPIPDFSGPDFFDPGGDLVGPDLAPLLRAHRAHARLGMREKFGELYSRRRYAQLDSDLQVSEARPFLDRHRSFIDRIAGHFVVESRVSRAAEGVAAEDRGRAMWETASRKLTALLQEELGRADPPAQVAAVAGRVGLLAAALEPYGYEVGPLLASLDHARERYHDLLLEHSGRLLADLSTVDGRFERLVIRSEAEYDSLISKFGLAETEERPGFPFVSAFSSAVPDTCRVVRSFLDASAAYPGGNPPASSERYLDRLADLLAGALIDTARPSRPEAEYVQLAADVAALQRACAFFSLKGSRALENAGEVAVSALVERAKAQVGDRGRDDVAAYLEELMGTVRGALPERAVGEIGRRVFGHVCAGFVGAFVGEGVRRFDPGVVGRVARDLSRVESVAGGLGFAGTLQEARQMVDFLTSAEPERYGEKEEREGRYGALDVKTVVAACDRFRDSGEGIFGSLGARPGPRKRSMELLKRRLKESGLVV